MIVATTVETESRVNYTPMRFYEDGRESPYYNSIIPLDPGVNLRFTLPYVGPDVFLDGLTTTLGLGEPSAYELRNIWGDIEEFGFGSVSFTSLYEALWYYNKRPRVYLGHLSFGVNCAKLPLFQDKD